MKINNLSLVSTQFKVNSWSFPNQKASGRGRKTDGGNGMWHGMM